VKIKEEVKEILKKNSYIVKLQKADDGILVLFPKRVMEPKTETTGIYFEYKKDGIRIEKIDEKNNYEFFIPCPIYAQRTYIMYCICTTCFQMGYNTDFIEILDSGNSAFVEFLNNKLMTGDDYIKEAMLVPEVESSVKSGFRNKTEDEKISEGVELIKELLLETMLNNEESSDE
jgi:hypothetical protein